MAKRKALNITADTSGGTSFFGFNWKTAAVAAGVAFLAPYLVRRLLPLFQGDAAMDTTANDVIVTGKDAVRDAQDDLGVDGVRGKISRTVDRVADRLTH